MQSQSYHSKLANRVNTPSLSQKSFNHNQFDGMKNNTFQKVSHPGSRIVNSVNISTNIK